VTLSDLGYRLGLNLRPQFRVYASFFLYSFSMGGFFPRLGELQRALGVAEGAFGLALIGAAAGTLVTLTFGGRVIERVGYRAVVLALLPCIAVFYALASFASGPLAMFLLLLPVGMCIGAVEQVVNLEADRVEHQLGYRIMNRAHAFWSFGFASASLLGAGLSQLGVSPQAHLIGMVPVLALATLLLLGRFEPAPSRNAHPDEQASHFASPTGAILMLVSVTLAAMVMEGAGADWSAIYMRDVFGASPGVMGMAVTAGALAQACTRFVADRFVDKHSPLLVARVLLSVLALGVVMVYLAPSAWVALTGLALMGVGTSAIFPLAMSAAAQRTDRPAATNVAALAQTAFVSFMLGPPLLGFVAEHWGIRAAFGIGIPLVLLGFWASKALATVPKA
jgi:MFS family permease